MNYFYVEGKTDKTFLSHFLVNIVQIEQQYFEIITLGGGDRLNDKNRTFETATTRGDSVYILLDYDDDKKYEERKNILTSFKDKEIIVDFFFLKKDLEEFLLSSLKNDKDKKILSCIEEYEKCIGKELTNKIKLSHLLKAKGISVGDYEEIEFDH